MKAVDLGFGVVGCVEDGAEWIGGLGGPAWGPEEGGVGVAGRGVVECLCHH